MTIELIPLDKIKDNPYQPRTIYDGIEELAENIRRMADARPETGGLIHVPVGRWLADGTVQLAEGHRRLRAFRLHQTGPNDGMPVDITPLTDEQMDDIAWSENRDRKDLNPIEEATALARTMAERKLTQEQLAGLRGLGRSTVANLVRLLSLPEAFQQAIIEGKLTSQHGAAYLPVLDFKEADIETAKKYGMLSDRADFDPRWSWPTPAALLNRLLGQADLTRDQVRDLVKKMEGKIEEAKKRKWDEVQAEEARRKAEAAARAEALAATDAPAETEGDDEADWLQPDGEEVETGEEFDDEPAEPAWALRQPAPKPATAAAPPPPPPPPAPKPTPAPVKPTWYLSVSIKPSDNGLADSPALITLTEGLNQKASETATYEALIEKIQSLITEHIGAL